MAVREAGGVEPDDQRALVVVEARRSLGAMPGVILEPLGDRTVLEVLLDRLEPLRRAPDTEVVVATTDLVADDEVVRLAEAAGVPAVRGPDDDPLTTFSMAMVRHPAHQVVRLKATGPLADPYVVRAALDLHRREEADVTTNLLPRTYPEGLEVEVISPRPLRSAVLESTEPADRLGVTRYLVRRPERFRLANLDSGYDASGERWTASHRADLARLGDLLASVPDPLSASWNRILAVTGRRNRPQPGEVVLRALPAPAPGSSPWERRWTVTIDGSEVGTVTVAAQGGRTTRSVAVPDDRREDALAALYRHLLDDDQATP